MNEMNQLISDPFFWFFIVVVLLLLATIIKRRNWESKKEEKRPIEEDCLKIHGINTMGIDKRWENNAIGFFKLNYPEDQLYSFGVIKKFLAIIEDARSRIFEIHSENVIKIESLRKQHEQQLSEAKKKVSEKYEQDPRWIEGCRLAEERKAEEIHQDFIRMKRRDMFDDLLKATGKQPTDQQVTDALITAGLLPNEGDLSE